MNKKYWYTILSVLLLAALALAIFLIYKQSIETTPAITNPGTVLPSKEDIKLIQAELDKNEAAFNKAQTNNDLELCKTITNTDVQRTCSAQINLNAALSSKQISACEKINDAMFKRSCVEQLATQDEADACKTLTDSSLQDTCLSIVYYEQAKANNKAETCNSIPELIRRANCLSELKNIDIHSDNDGDGLDFLQEIMNDTNPDNRDTDGDGYQDGFEFQQGFNPDGSGSLNAAIPTNDEYCQKLSDERLKIICINEFAGKPLDLFDCNQVKAKDLHDYCLKNPIIK